MPARLKLPLVLILACLAVGATAKERSDTFCIQSPNQSSKTNINETL